MKWLLLLISFVVTDIAIAAPRVNNGGGGWACRKPESGEVVWVKTADLIQNEYYDLNSSFSEKSGDVLTLFNEQRAFIKQAIPELDELLESNPLVFGRNIRWIDGPLAYVPDAELQYKPPALSCPEGIVSFVQLVSTTIGGDILFSPRVWNLPTFSGYQKSAALLHEQVYYALRKKFGDGSSVRTRDIVGLIYSGLDEKTIRRRVVRSLKEPPRANSSLFGYKNTPALFNVNVTCFYGLNNGKSRYEWKPGIKQHEFMFVEDNFGLYVRTSKVDGSPQRLEIMDFESKNTVVLEIPNAVPIFNNTKSVELYFKGPNRDARLTCESQSNLDDDPL